MRHVVKRTAKAIIGYELYRAAGFASIKRWYINDNSSSVMSKVEWSSIAALMTTIQRINIMIIIIGLFFILSCEMLNNGSASKEHVHFKIHVPEIIKHNIHTKTVFIHVHKLPKKIKPKTEAPETYHKESHHKDWSSWRSYSYNSDYDDQTDDNRVMSENPKDHVINEKDHKEIDPPLHQHRDSYLPALQHDDKPNLKSQYGNMVGYSYPPQYAVHEDVKELDHNNIKPYMHMYEEGYHRSGESVNGQAYSKDLTKFYEDKHEEGDHSIEDYEKESKEKTTHAGRYFVDDSEYLQNADKYEAEKRLSRRMLPSL